ncbi:hypothetical protein GIB67_039150, partial [Kingdonia uniflora]
MQSLNLQILFYNDQCKPNGSEALPKGIIPVHLTWFPKEGVYISVVKEEGLHISQLSLDATKFKLHHQITTRGRRLRIHRVHGELLFLLKEVGRNYGTYFLKRSLTLYVVYDP